MASELPASTGTPGAGGNPEGRTLAAARLEASAWPAWNSLSSPKSRGALRLAGAGAQPQPSDGAAGAVASPSERQIITVLAADIVGSTRHIAACDPDDAQAFYDSWFEYVRETVERADGMLVSYAGDGGIAVFGWPTPLEDHADRACVAAWDIERANQEPLGPGGAPVQFRVGVHSGLAAVRQLDRGGASRFDTVGATVNIAAKLQQCAPPGGVLISAQTAGLCRSRLNVTPHRPAPAFGAVQIEAFRLRARPERLPHADLLQRYRAPMVGRERELKRLRDMLPGAHGMNHAVALVGEAGIGKSRLAAAILGEAEALGARTYVHFGEAQKRTTPFSVARGLVGRALDLEGSPSREDLAAAIAGRALDETVRAAFEAILSAPEDGDKRLKLTQTQLARALADGFGALAFDAPTLILVEDLHLVDPESRLFLKFLSGVPAAHSCLTVLTARTEAMEAAEALTRNLIRLEPLPDQAMTDLAGQLWAHGAPSAQTLRRLVDRAEGVPFVLEELVRSVEGEHLPALPHGVESVIHARLQRLTPSAKRLAQVLSLLGEHVDIELAGAMLGGDAAALAGDLSELERFAFIHPVTDGSAHMRHQIIADACVNTIPRDRRAALHAAALSAITERYSLLSGRYEQLAFHAEGARDEIAALDYLWLAGLEARRNSASASLNLIFDRAIELIGKIREGTEERYVDFVLMAFALMVQLGEFDKMNTHLPRVIELARRWGRPSLVSSSLSQLGMICWFEGRYEESLKATREGLALARELDAPALIFSNQIMLANALHDLGHVREAIDEGRKICAMLAGDLETARLGATGIPKAIALSFLSWFMADTGDYAAGLEASESALEIATREQDPYSEVLARSALGRSLLMLGRNDDAVECMTAALRLSEQNGYDAINPDLAGRTAMALSRAGRTADALAVVEDCMAKGLHRRTGQLEVYYLYAGHAEALIRHGWVEAGRARFADALTIARRVKNPCWTAELLGLRAHLMGLAAPGGAGVAADIAERARLCERYGLAAWEPREVALG